MKFIITEEQNNELNSLKGNIEMIERNIENAQTELEIAQDVEDHAKVIKIEKAINHGNDEILKMVKIQAQSMNLKPRLVLDLIFDREYMIELMNKNN